MKNLPIAALLLLANLAHAQVVNWGVPTAEANRLLYVQAGFDYGLSYGAGFAYRFDTKIKVPVLLNADFSAPLGEHIFDDFKVRIGGQVDLLKFGDVHLSGQWYGIFRRQQTDFVRLTSFGSEASGVLGYYRRHWFVAGEFGFDKAIVTHFKHTAAYRDVYPEVEDGWFEPATGGNYHYGLQTGCNFGRNAITLKAGWLTSQNWTRKPTVPYYAAVGYARVL
jgi:hypothetical protein